MKSQKTITRENTRLSYSLLDSSKAIKTNSVKTSKQLTDKHEDMKWKICRQLTKEGKDFITEAIFKNGKRCDILVPGSLLVIEVLASEDIKDCKNKVEEYPIVLEKIFVDADVEFNERLIY